MKRFEIALCVASAGAILAGCATGLTDSVTYRISAAGDGNRYALACTASSTGNCFIRIDGPEGKVSHEIVPAGATRTLQDAVPGASFCVSASDPIALVCKANHARFGPEGTVQSISRT